MSKEFCHSVFGLGGVWPLPAFGHPPHFVERDELELSGTTEVSVRTPTFQFVPLHEVGRVAEGREGPHPAKSENRVAATPCPSCQNQLQSTAISVRLCALSVTMKCTLAARPCHALGTAT
jgi:hypothetical protein